MHPHRLMLRRRREADWLFQERVELARETLGEFVAEVDAKRETETTAELLRKLAEAIDDRK